MGTSQELTLLTAIAHGVAEDLRAKYPDYNIQEVCNNNVTPPVRPFVEGELEGVVTEGMGWVLSRSWFLITFHKTHIRLETNQIVRKDHFDYEVPDVLDQLYTEIGRITAQPITKYP